MLSLALYQLGVYFIGAIPFAYIFTKYIDGVDVTRMGSKNSGATNALRVGSKLSGFLTLICDFAKGGLCVYLAKHYFPESSFMPGITMIVCVLGHMFSIFLFFKGGKGVATSLGGLAFFSPGIFAFSIFCWILIFIYKKTSSLASIITFAAAAICALVQFSFIQQIFVVPLSVIVLLAHWENIVRLFQGTEKKIQKKG